jgi:hypothetical protein
MSFDDFVDLDHDFRGTYEANRQAVTLSEAEAADLDRLTAPVSVIALVDRGCSDVMATLPIMVVVAERAPGLRLSILLRTGANADLAQRYARGEGSRIPTYVFVTDRLDELGTIVERTTAVDQRIGEFLVSVRAEYPDSDPTTFPASLPASARETFMERVLDHRASLREVERASLVADVLRLTDNVNSA